jgi:hypothetical protein
MAGAGGNVKKIGYVCALATSALEGAVYVGTTTRVPSDWAKELSRSMRLSSPFIVAYEQLFVDSEESALSVFRSLEQKGYKIFSGGGNEGQFVRAPVSEAVKAIQIAPGAMAHASFDPYAANTAGVDGSATDMYRVAQCHYYGLDGYRKDYAEAFRLFSKAATSGCPAAYRNLAQMTRNGDGVDASEAMAIDILNAGLAEGSIACRFALAEHYTKAGVLGIAETYAALFVQKFSYDSIDGAFLTRSDVNAIELDCAMLVHKHLHREMPVPESLRNFIVDNAGRVRAAADDFATNALKRGERSDASRWRDTVRWIDSLPMQA